jgi:hypothetical protein
MEMTRRRFVRIITGVASAFCGGLYRLSQRAVPRRVVRALRLGKYPGEVVPMGDMGKQSKWSG